VIGAAAEVRAAAGPPCIIVPHADVLNYVCTPYVPRVQCCMHAACALSVSLYLSVDV
jgi:hypothetical protein